jgi:replicative DNA helicase
MQESLTDYHAEELVIAYIVLNNENFDNVSAILTEKSFSNQIFQEIYSACSILVSRSRTADPHSIAQHIRMSRPNLITDKPIEEILTEAVSKYINSIAIYNVIQKAELIRNLYQKREAIKAVQEFVPEVSQNENPQDAVQNLEERLYHIMEDKQVQDFVTIANVFSGILNKIESIKKYGTKLAIDTGYHDINAKISGWSDGDLIILAGRPSMGKTALAIGMALNAAKSVRKDNKAVAVFSLEMSAEQLVNRMIAVETGVPSNKIASGMVTDGEFSVIMGAMNDFGLTPIVIDDTPAISIPELRTKIRRMKRKHNIAFAVVDYLQLMRSSSKAKDNRVQEISDITQNLKAIAREFKIPLIALSQLSRNVESRDDKRPQLQDLRDSGSIEQDADIVMFLYREAYYMERSMPSKENIEQYNQWMAQNGDKYGVIENTAEVIIAKHRNGPIGTAFLRFDQQTTRFDNLAKSENSGRSSKNTPF